MLSQVEDENGIPSEREMCEQLYSDSEKMAGIFRICYEMAEQQGDHGLANFLAERQDGHKKHCWMLRSTLK
jgi:DNA-binding ferritin-like protein